MKRTITTKTFASRMALSFFLALLLPLGLGSCASSTGPAPKQKTAPLPGPAPEYRAAPIDPQTANFELSAIDFVKQLKAGWNLGNTLDATGAAGLGAETSWGQPKTTKDMFTGLKEGGFGVVRIPISWHRQMDNAFTIDEAWMDRVKEIVDWALEAGLYVIINTHHDNHKDYYFPDAEHDARSQEYLVRVWTQVGLVFRNYSEKLIFEFLNEPRRAGMPNEWNWNDNDSQHREAGELIAKWIQEAVKAVRATGSNNENRYLMVTGYAADVGAAMSPHFSLPKDSATDKLIVSCHAYTPYVFAMQSPGQKEFTAQHEREISSFLKRLNDKFIDGLKVPVIIGEYGATNKNNLEEREKWYRHYAGTAASYGMSTIVWDNGGWKVPRNNNYSELYGFYNRTKQSWYFPTLLRAIVEAYE